MTIKDIAKLAGVSIGTASNYFNYPKKLSESAYNKVHEVVEKHNFRPNNLAKTMRTGKTNMIAVVLPLLTNHYYVCLYDSIQKELSKYGYTTIVYTTENGADFLDNLLLNDNKQTDGVILCFVEDESHNHIKNLPPESPVIQLRTVPPEVDLGCIVSDLYNGILETIDHLYSCGHRRIGYVEHVSANTGKPHTHSQEKLRGIYDGFKKYNIPYDNKYIYCGSDSFETGFMAAKYFTQLETPPTAIIAENDTTAIGTLHYLNEYGYKIPDDIAVVGYDDIWEASLCFPQLTTVRQRISDIGETAVKYLIDKIADPSIKNPITIFDTSLVVRKSTDKNAPLSTYM